MAINIPPALFGQAEIYSPQENDIPIPLVAGDVNFIWHLLYGPIYGLPRAAWIDLIIHRTKNSNALANNWTVEEFDASFDRGTTWFKVNDNNVPWYVGAVGFRYWERLYGPIDILQYLDLVNGGEIWFRLINAEAALATITLEKACFVLRVTNLKLGTVLPP